MVGASTNVSVPGRFATREIRQSRVLATMSGRQLAVQLLNDLDQPLGIEDRGGLGQ